MSRPPEPGQIAAYREKIINEICYALGLSREGAMRLLLGPLFRRPAHRFGRIAALADGEVEESGISGGARRILPELSLTPAARGAEDIPREGPLVVAANHPGAFDSVAILSCIPRKDVKVFISDVPFTRAFQAADRYFIYTPKDAPGRMGALRSAIKHLQAGGSVLIFANGDVEPDPELSPGAEEALQGWSRSLEILLRKVPETWLQLAIASGVLMPKFMRSPLVRIRRTAPRRQKLAEVLQISRQMLFPASVRTDVHISFGKPVRGRSLAGNEWMPVVIRMVRNLLDDHMASLKAPGRDPAWRISGAEPNSPPEGGEEEDCENEDFRL
jgi:1-acyl-sn-glycerol-3-phosphate acyltransferase